MLRILKFDLSSGPRYPNNKLIWCLYHKILLHSLALSVNGNEITIENAYIWVYLKYLFIVWILKIL